MKALALTIELSELFEQAEAEGGLVAQLVDAEIMPLIRSGLYEAESVGLGDRFALVIDKVRTSANRTGNDRIRTLKDMLKSALSTYVKNTHDALTARGVYHHSIQAGSDTMLASAAAAILANALCGQHSKEAQSLMQKVVGKLTGLQKIHAQLPAMENASGAAVGAGSIATVPGGKKKKRRKDSIFAEGEVIPFPKSNPRVQARSPLMQRIEDKGRLFFQARRMAEEMGWRPDGHQKLPDHEVVAAFHRDPSGSGIPLAILSNGWWAHMGTRGEGPESLQQYLAQHTIRLGESMINEDVVPLPGAAQEPVQNVPLGQADDPSNVHMLRPQSKLFHDKPVTDKFWVALFLPKEGEQEFHASMDQIMDICKHYGITKFDQHNSMFYAPSQTTGTVPTLFVYGPGKRTLSPVQMAQIATNVQQFLASPAHMESVSWDDLIGEPTAMEVLREVEHTGTPHRYDGVLVDPTTAELVLSAHSSMTAENQQRYEQKRLRQMITIAERAVQRGVIQVSLEEHDDPNTDSISRANSHGSSDRDEINFKIKQIKRLRQSARWKAEKLKPHYARLRELEAQGREQR